MKLKKIACLAAVLLTSLSVTKAQNTIAQWTFENLAITNYVPNPAPNLNNALGAVSVTTLGMTNWAASSYGTNDPDVLLGVTGDTGANGITNYTHEWRVRAQGPSANGWSSQAPVGTQGAQFNVDTTGYTSVSVAFDWYLTSAGEANIQFQYTTDGVTWSNLPITIPAAQDFASASNVDNTLGLDTNSVIGNYVHCMPTSTGQQWFTNLTVTITDPAVANNTNFAFQVVNASTGAACVNAKGTALNNTSGNWRFDNILVSGTTLPRSIAAWNFENVAITNYAPNPAPSLNNSLGAVSVAALGMNIYPTPAVATNDPDVLAGATSDTGANGISNLTQVWRVRGQKVGNGWSSLAPVGTQGAQFSADTTGFTNITVAFDWYLTTQGEANLELQYTTDGITWNNVPITLPSAPGADGGLTVVDNSDGSDSGSVTGSYISDNSANNGSLAGQDWFTNLTATINDPAAGNNPLFAIQLVNASTGASCVNTAGAGLNNSSGNWRFDNIIIGGLPGGTALLTPPAITAASGATVDGPFTNTFTDSAQWRTNISSIKVNNTVLTAGYAITAGQIVYTPAASVPANLLQTAGSDSITIIATNYTVDAVTQTVGSGAPTQVAITMQPAGPSASGGTLTVQPALAVADQYGNPANHAAGTVVATVASGAWNFGAGSGTTQLLTNGVVTFTNLSAVSASAVSGAAITFTMTGAGLGSFNGDTINSSSFNISAPATAFTAGNLAVEQLDLITKNTTFSMLEVNPALTGQTTPVNIFPVPATGTNDLRQSSSGSTGRLADSDDGTLLCFSAALLGDSTVADSTTIDPRGAGTFNSLGLFNLGATYTGQGDTTADQARSAVTIDDTNFFMGDKGGVYINGDGPTNNYIAYTTGNGANVRSLKSFGGTIYALQQEGGSDPYAQVINFLSLPASYPAPIAGAPANGSQELFPVFGLGTNASVTDFYLLKSGNTIDAGTGRTVYDYGYFICESSTTSGSIYKCYFTGGFNAGQQVWSYLGSEATPNGGDGLCARTNSAGGVDLFYTTGDTGTGGNSVVTVNDSAAWNQPINLGGFVTNYTVAATSLLRGIAFAPVISNSISGGGTVSLPLQFTPGSIKITGSGATATCSFSFTNAPGLTFSVLGTNVLGAPPATWPVVGTATENPAGSGQYQFTDPNPTTNATEFYILRH